MTDRKSNGLASTAQDDRMAVEEPLKIWFCRSPIAVNQNAKAAECFSRQISPRLVCAKT